MSFFKKTIRDVPLEHQTVLLRADYNVPLKANGKIADDYRMVQSLPTLKFLTKAGCKVVIIAHLGRPKGKDEKFSLEPIATHLGKLLKQPVGFVPDCIGDKVAVAVKKMKPGQVILLENLRFYDEEESNSAVFAKKIAKSASAKYFVQDGFGVVHRAHASTSAITHVLPSAAGLLLEKEFNTITQALQNPKKPLVAVLGGAKVSDKITVIERFVQMADQIIIGGAMANTFLKYRGLPIGKSVHEEGQEQLIERIYAAASQKVGDKNVDDFILLPKDVAVAPQIGPGQKRVIVDIKHVQPNEYILDLGPVSTEHMLAHLNGAKSVIWSGTLGLTEQLIFAYSSAKLATFLTQKKQNLFSIVGGGDTAEFVLNWDAKHGRSFGLVSTGGSASLQLMAGKKLPGVEALMNAS